MEHQLNNMINSSSHQEIEVSMMSEQGLIAKKPYVDNFENEDLANASQIAEQNDRVHATDEFHLENARESREASLEEKEVPEESCQDLIEEDKTGEYTDNINNEEGSNQQKVLIGSKLRIKRDIQTKNKVLQKLTRAPRYFDPPEWFSLESSGYDQNNGQSEKDKVKRKRSTCYICGDNGHDGNRCKKVNDCLICSQKGHLIIDCPDKNPDEDCASILCLMCGNKGHDMLSCTNGYDSEDLENIQCYICEEFGHLCCVDSKAEEAREVSCYRCGETGHLGFECIKLTVVNDPQSMQLCTECKERGYSLKECIKCLEANSSKTTMEKAATGLSKSAKRNARKARQAARARNAYPGPPNRAHTGWRQQVMGPYYGRPGSNVWLSPAARSNANHPAQGLPSHQVPDNSTFDPMSQLPHVFWNSGNSAQNAQSLYPMTQLPHLIWNSGNQNPQQTPNHQTGTEAQAESQMAQNSSTQPSQLLPHVIYNNQQPENAVIDQPVNHETGILLPHQLLNNQTGNQNSTSSPSVLVTNPSSTSL